MSIGPIPKAEELLDISSQKAFVSFVDDNYIEGFLVLLRSLILTNPTFNFDYVVLHDRLGREHFRRIEEIYPRIRAVQVDTSVYRQFTKGNRANYLFEKAYYILDIFKLRGYSKLVALDTDMVVLGNIMDLFAIDAPFAACPQYFDSENGRNLNSGLLVVGEELLDGTTSRRIEEIGRSGEYELEKHDQGILSALFDGDYQKIHYRYNAVKRRFFNEELPEDIKILHFTGAVKPWTCAERGYTKIQSAWEQFRLSQKEFTQQAAKKASRGRNSELAVFYARQHFQRYGFSRAVAMDVHSSFLALGLAEEWIMLVTRLGGARAEGSESLNRLVAEALRRARGTTSAEALLRGTTSALLNDDKAMTELAMAEWIERDNDSAELLTESIFRRAPYSRAARMMVRRVECSRSLDAEWDTASDASIAHAAFYMTRHGNAGDIVLPDSVRAAIDVETKRHWVPLHVHQRVNPRTVDQLNRLRGMVIGGGGLFLKDTGPNPNSGWQWNISLRELEAIKIPIALFAVGYNRFPGQSDFAPIFTKHTTKLLEKSSFFGLRNIGSVEAFREYVPTELRPRVKFQPCPTVVAAKLFPGEFEVDRRKNYIAINLAFDRPELRFGDSYQLFLRNLARFCLAIREDIEVRFFAHAVVDEQATIDLSRELGIALPCDRLYELDTNGIFRKYQEPQLVIGMRGHAGMIPFGCRTPIVSIVSHRKLQFFLDDIKMPDRGIPADASDLDERLLELSRRTLAQHDAEVAKIDVAMERMWEVTRDNVAAIRRAFDASLA